MELEPVAVYVDSSNDSRAQIAVVSYTYGGRFGSLVPFVGGGIGFFTLQTRMGIAWMPGDLQDTGFIMRLDARPQMRFGQCWEPMVLGSLGAGIRFPLERGDPSQPGTAAFLLPSFTGGVGFLHDTCSKPDDGPLSAKALYGGTFAGGFDF